MKPLIRALLVIARHHIPVAHAPARAVFAAIVAFRILHAAVIARAIVAISGPPGIAAVVQVVAVVPVRAGHDAVVLVARVARVRFARFVLAAPA